jgi:hypothetical protein
MNDYKELRVRPFPKESAGNEAAASGLMQAQRLEAGPSERRSQRFKTTAWLEPLTSDFLVELTHQRTSLGSGAAAPFPLLDPHLVASDCGELDGEHCQVVVVGCKEGAGTVGFERVFEAGPDDREARH